MSHIGKYSNPIPKSECQYRAYPITLPNQKKILTGRTKDVEVNINVPLKNLGTFRLKDPFFTIKQVTIPQKRKYGKRKKTTSSK